jgi:hypothetical protein
MQVEGLPDCWSPIVEDIEPTSKTIQKTRNMLVGCISLDDIRKNLLIQGLNDKQIFFAIEAGKILSRIVDICPCCNEDHSEGNSIMKSVRNVVWIMSMSPLNRKHGIAPIAYKV